MISRLFAAFTFNLLLALSGFSQKNSLLSPSEFEKQISQAGIQVLDVRTSEEYVSGHIKNALQADWLKREEFKDRVQYLDKTKPIYVYCGSGVRSSAAAKWLSSNGFQHVSELESGFIAWKKNNKPIESEIEVTQLSMAEYHSLLDTSSPVLIDFGAKWCPPCKKMEPVLEQLQKDLSTKFILIKVDAGVHTKIMQQLQVEKLPTFILYKNARETWRKEGLVSLEEFKSNIE
jgi:rhodanese-related sulfurtransferase